jgi:hypothetical protein
MALVALAEVTAACEEVVAEAGIVEEAAAGALVASACVGDALAGV